MGQYLLKFLKEEEHQKDFLDGKLYTNTLKSFKEYEKNDFNRSDKFEAIVKHIHVHYDAIQIGDLVISKEEISPSHETTNTRKYDYCNIFCMYALWKKTEIEEIIVDEKNKFFGKYCVCITDIKEFLNRIEKAVDEKDIVCHYMSVDYIDKNQEHTIEEDKIPFTKFDNFAYQREFRIAIDTKKNINEAYVLDIGNLRDIAFITTIDKINAQLLLISDSACENK